MDNFVGQLLGFNTTEPSVHNDLLKKSIKRMHESNVEFKQKLRKVRDCGHSGNSQCFTYIFSAQIHLHGTPTQYLHSKQQKSDRDMSGSKKHLNKVRDRAHMQGVAGCVVA